MRTGLEVNKRKDGGAVARAVEAAKAAGGRVETADKHDMNLLVDHRPHQVPGHLWVARYGFAC